MWGTVYDQQEAQEILVLMHHTTLCELQRELKFGV